MSYSSQLRQEIATTPTGKSCDVTAELAALIVLSGTITRSGGGTALRFELENLTVIRRIYELLQNKLSEVPEVAQTRGFKKSPLYTLKLSPQDTAALLKSCFAYDGSIFFIPVPRQDVIKKRCCKLAFLRGAYLGGGVILDPKKSYQLEFVAASEEFSRCLIAVLAHFGITAKLTQRSGSNVVYIKSAEGIADFLTAIGANQARLEMENVRIIKETRSVANRVTNCDTANITRTVDAAERQLDAIRYIQKKQGLDSLPQALFNTAEARINNPEAPLSELAQMLDVSRSGLNHRFDRILLLADMLREESGEL